MWNTARKETAADVLRRLLDSGFAMVSGQIEQEYTAEDDTAADDGGGIGDLFGEEETENAGEERGDEHIVADLRGLFGFRKSNGPGDIGDGTGADAQHT